MGLFPYGTTSYSLHALFGSPGRHKSVSNLSNPQVHDGSAARSSEMINCLAILYARMGRSVP